MIHEKSRKAEKFPATKRMKNMMLLHHCRNEYNSIVHQLHNLSSLLPIVRVENPSIELDDYAKQLVDKRVKLFASIVQLEKVLMENRQGLNVDYQGSRGIDIPGGFPGRDDPRFWEGLLIQRELERLNRHRPVDRVISPSCGSDSGLATLTAVHECEMLGPYDPNSEAQNGFTDTYDGGSIIVSFVTNRISSGNFGDTMQSRRIYDFTLPAAPCAGRITCHYAGYIMTTPNISATNGSVSSKIRSLLHKSGDGIDPLDDTVGWRNAANARESMNAAIGDWGDPDPQFDIYNSQWSIEVNAGDVPVFHYSVVNYMYAFQGVASFEDEGIDCASAVFQLPNGVESDEFGIWWEFQPDG